jgi:hypothetical protein
VARLKNLRVLMLKLRIVDRPGSMLAHFSKQLRAFNHLQEVVFLFDEPHVAWESGPPSPHLLGACADAIVSSMSCITAITLGGFMTFNDSKLDSFFSLLSAKQPGVRSLRLIRLSRVSGDTLLHLTQRGQVGTRWAPADSRASLMSKMQQFSVIDCAKVLVLELQLSHVSACC